jgi:hypothetical protein
MGRGVSVVPRNPKKVAEAAGGANMLDVGESAQATIEEKKKWNHTSIELVSGHKYHFVAPGR